MNDTIATRRMSAASIGAAPASEILPTRVSAINAALTSPIRILHPVWRLACGGLERQLVDAVNSLPRDVFRHSVLVRGWSDESELLAGRLGSHVEVIRDGDDSGSGGAWSRRLARLIQNGGFDLIHIRGVSMLPDAVMAADWVGGVPVMFSFHGFESATAQLSGVRRKVYRDAAHRAADRWAVSASAAAAIAGRLNLPADSFGVIPNGVDVDRFQPCTDKAAAKRRVDLPSDRTVFVCCGNLKPVKGHAVLLDAIEQMGVAAAGITWIIAGQDFLDGTLQARAAKLSHVDVRFVGAVDDVRPWLDAADAFVLPSLWEGMSNALLEAMAAGLPVIATRVGGNADVIADESCGLLVEPGSATQLAFAVQRLHSDAQLQSLLAANARRRAEAYSRTSMLMAYEQRYQAVISACREATNETSEPTAKMREVAGAPA